ncbi:hypothetical protein BB561_006050 [Smittium simulii]|uniref:Serine/threonine-protein kinase n=1 Tax=Smittium simulii TaxID=133385 RepID=A0A2T9Y6W7_9FUNG|nr:hypothetical protein BB561_006050 [Smittium simulii]
MRNTNIEYFKNPDGSKIPRILFDPNDKLNTCYEIIEILGIGSFGKCYRVKDISNESADEWACKILDKTNITTGKIRERLQFEVQIVQSLPKHPRIAYGQKVFQDEYRIYIIMELCSKRTMETLIKTRKRLSEFEAKYFFSQVVEGIVELHRRRIIHRDIKLANILLTSRNQIKIGDFGLSAFLENPGDRKTSFLGTLNYLSPEVVQRSKYGHSFAVDVWALGVFLYVMLVGKTPFMPKQKPAKPENYYYEICKGNIDFPPDIPISDEAKNLIFNLCQKSEEKRIKSNYIKLHPWLLNHRNSIPYSMPDQIFSYSIHPLKWNKEIEAGLYSNKKLTVVNKQAINGNENQKNEKFKNAETTLDKFCNVGIAKINELEKIDSNSEKRKTVYFEKKIILPNVKDKSNCESSKPANEVIYNQNANRFSSYQVPTSKHVAKINKNIKVSINANFSQQNKQISLLKSNFVSDNSSSGSISNNKDPYNTNQQTCIDSEKPKNATNESASFANSNHSSENDKNKQDSLIIISENRFTEEQQQVVKNKEHRPKIELVTQQEAKLKTVPHNINPEEKLNEFSKRNSLVENLKTSGNSALMKNMTDNDLAMTGESNKKPDSSLMNIWQAKLEVLSVRFNYFLSEGMKKSVNEISIDENFDQESQDELPVHLIRFVRVPKYGLGYELTNGTFGVSFRDKTSLLSTKNSDGPLIVIANKTRVEIKQLPPVSEIGGLKQKLALFSQFECAVKEQSVLKHFQKNNKFADDPLTPCIFVTKYLSAKNVSMYRLSNGTIQVCFKDGSQLLLFAENKISFTNKTSFSMTFDIRDKTSDILSSNKVNSNELINRINYTSKVLEAAL